MKAPKKKRPKQARKQEFPIIEIQDLRDIGGAAALGPNPVPNPCLPSAPPTCMCPW